MEGKSLNFEEIFLGLGPSIISAILLRLVENVLDDGLIRVLLVSRENFALKQRVGFYRIQKRRLS
jgi:hypothetical protein